jgi:hypothetical protein
MAPDFQSSENYDHLHENSKEKLFDQEIDLANEALQSQRHTAPNSSPEIHTELRAEAQNAINALKANTRYGAPILKVFQELNSKFENANIAVDQSQAITSKEIVEIVRSITAQELENKKHNSFQKIKAEIGKWLDPSRERNTAADIIGQCNIQGLLKVKFDVYTSSAFSPANYNLLDPTVTIIEIREISITKLGKVVAKELGL